MAVVYQCGNSGGLYTNVGQAAAVKLQFIRIPRRQCHGAQLRHDHAAVAHLRCQQGDVAAEFGVEIAVVFNLAGGAIAREVEVASHEVGVADAVRGGGESADIHAGAAAEIDAAAVGQENLAVGVDVAKDLAWVGVEHAVQGGRVAGGLDEVDRGGAADVESTPVDGGTVGRLRDVQRGTGLGNGGLPGHDLSAGGQLSGCGWIGWRCIGWRQTHHAAGSGQQDGPSGAPAASLDRLRDSNPGVGDFVVNQAVGLVHGAALELGAVSGSEWQTGR